MIKNCVYFCEGPCEEALIKALQKAPALIAAGRPRLLNVIQNVIPKLIHRSVTYFPLNQALLPRVLLLDSE